ncbi:MAG: hypothetical protein FWD01_01870 [Defluviitaleaceae bacterium]|nr:hypothetical protein [Defluviitaleaceae bacterium]
MMYLAIALFITAIALLLVETLTAGMDFGISGILGFAALAASVVITVVYHQYGIFIVLGQFAVLIPVAVVFVRWLRRKQIYGKFILNETLAEDKSDISGLERLVGKEGITKTALRPHGQAIFDNSNDTKPVEVWCDSYIPQNERVKVTDIKDHKVFVKLVEGN